MYWRADDAQHRGAVPFGTSDAIPGQGLAADLAHRLGGPNEISLPDLVSLFFLPDGSGDEIANLHVRAPPRSRALTSCSWIENKQVRRWPSAVSRIRLQTLQ